MTHLRYKLISIILLVAIAVLGGHRLLEIYQFAHEPSHSFINYYTASTLLAQGAEVEQFYDDTWYANQVMNLTPNIGDIYQPHPPTSAFMMLPLVNFSHLTARFIWICLTLLSVIVAIIWLFKHEQFTNYQIITAVFVILIYQPLYANFEYGQIYGVLFALLVGILYCYQHQYSSGVGGILGMMLIFKLTGYVFILFLMIKRKWIALLSAGVAMMSIFILTLPRLSISSWLTFLEMLPQHTQRPSFAVTAYQSIAGYFKHHLLYDEFWNPSPLMDAPVIATLLSSGVILGLLAFTCWQIYKCKNVSLIVSALVLLTVLISPASLDYHYAIILLPVLLLLGYMPDMKRLQIASLWVGIILLSLDYPYQQAQYDQTFLSLLAYPKLIGGTILLFLSLNLMANDRDDS